MERYARARFNGANGITCKEGDLFVITDLIKKKARIIEGAHPDIEYQYDEDGLELLPEGFTPENPNIINYEIF